MEKKVVRRIVLFDRILRVLASTLLAVDGREGKEEEEGGIICKMVYNS